MMIWRVRGAPTRFIALGAAMALVLAAALPWWSGSISFAVPLLRGHGVVAGVSYSGPALFQHVWHYTATPTVTGVSFDARPQTWLISLGVLCAVGLVIALRVSRDLLAVPYLIVLVMGALLIPGRPRWGHRDVPGFVQQGTQPAAGLWLGLAAAALSVLGLALLLRDRRARPVTGA